jgi:hypothetical protein
MNCRIVAFVMLYLTMMHIVGRRYFERRHGAPFSQHEEGAWRAAFIDTVWPITVWLDQVKHPEPCSHLMHVRQREAVQTEIPHSCATAGARKVF